MGRDSSLLGFQMFANVGKTVQDAYAIPSVSEPRLDDPDHACEDTPTSPFNTSSSWSNAH